MQHARMTPEEYEATLMLPAVEKIRAAESMIRREHRVIDDDWRFWGSIADHLNMAALIPSRTSHTSRDWRQFNRAQDIANGYIEMSARLNPHSG